MNKLQKRRVVLWGGVTSILVLSIAVALRPQPVPAELAPVARGLLQVSMDQEGRTRVRQRYVVSAPVSGQVLRIELEPGDPVRAGRTVLATLEPGVPGLLDARSFAEAQALVKAAEAVLERARAALELARAERTFADARRERLRYLTEAGVLSKAEGDQAETDARTRAEAERAATAAVRAAEHELEVARAHLVEAGRGADGAAPRSGRTLTLFSPIDGVVLRRLRESQAVVPAGEPLVEVANPEGLEIVADYLSADAVKIEPGMPARIDRWGGSRVLDARVRRVEPSGFLKVSALGVEEQRVNVILDFDDPREAWQALGDGYRIEVQVVIWEGAAVLKVPTGSLFRHDDGWAVFVVDSGRAHVRPIEIGHRNNLEAEVLSGLAEGDVVVVHPSDAVVDGVMIVERGV